MPIWAAAISYMLMGIVFLAFAHTFYFQMKMIFTYGLPCLVTAIFSPFAALRRISETLAFISAMVMFKTRSGSGHNTGQDWRFSNLEAR